MEASIIHRNEAAVPRLGEGIFLTKDVASIFILPYVKVRHLLKVFGTGMFLGRIKILL